MGEPSVVERVAAKVHEARFAHPRYPTEPFPFDQERPDGQEYCRRLARAAILETLRAIREPTPEMLEASTPEPTHLYGKDGRDDAYVKQMKVAVQVDRMVASSIWQAMIDTLLRTLDEGENSRG